MFLKNLISGLTVKIIVPVLLIVGLMAGALFSALQTDSSQLLKQAQITRDYKIKNLAAMYRLSRENPEALAEFANRLKTEKILTLGFIGLTDQNNRVVYKSDNVTEDVLAKIAFNAATSKFENWNVVRETIQTSNGNYTLIGTFAENDPQIQGEISSVTTSVLLGVALGVVLLLALFGYFVFSLVTRLKNLTEAADKIADGDFKVAIKADNGDEIGQLQAVMQRMVVYLTETSHLAEQIGSGNLTVKVKPRSTRDQFSSALQTLHENLVKFVKSTDERDQLQESIMKLLNEVSDVANGDLTAQAEVTPSMTGAIADAFNFMITELRSVIYRVMQASLQVSTAANQIRTTTERLAEGSEKQSEQITATSAAIEDMAASIQDVSQNAALSARVASESLVNAKNGTQAVQNNITAMNRIRQQVQETAKRIKRLGERSQEIGDIVKIIDDLADRTSTLALNASLQAASAGPAGRGFAVVAEEVERLAERSTHATKQIAGLTKSIQLETKDVVASMEETIQEVVGGSHLANEAGQALNEIEQVSHRLAELLQFISHAANQQARGSEDIARSMVDISKVTELVSGETKQTEKSAKDLVSLVNQLGSSVSTFKLPKNKDGSPNLLSPPSVSENSFYLN